MKQPNILLITSDQQHPDTLGCVGNPIIRTPHIDALAAEGTIFSQAFTTLPLCTPARTSIFTGLFAKHHGVRHNVNMAWKPGPPALPPERVAFPELLAKAGYPTAFFGKLHARHEGGKNFGLQIMRLAEGKGHFVGSPQDEDEYRRALRQRGYPPDISRTWELPAYTRDGYVTSPLPEKDYIDTFICDMALEHLSRAQGPFFCWVSFCTPHTALDPPQPYDTMYDPALMPPPHRRLGELEEKPRQWVDQLARTIHALPFTSTDPKLPGGIENAYRRFPIEKTQRMRAAYYGEVSHLDAQVGRLVQALKQKALYDNTLILFTSDHGDYCGDHWAFYKYGGLYDSLIRVPFVVRFLPGQGGRKRVDALVSLADVMPTLLEAAGVPCPDDLDGRSLRPLIAGHACPEPAERNGGWRQQLLIECGPTNALVTPDWKLVRWRDGTEELYDRVNDPHDLFNVAGKSSLADIQRELRSR